MLTGWRTSGSEPVQMRGVSITRMNTGHVDPGTMPGKSRKVTGKIPTTKPRRRRHR